MPFVVRSARVCKLAKMALAFLEIHHYLRQGHDTTEMVVVIHGHAENR